MTPQRIVPEKGIVISNETRQPLEKAAASLKEQIDHTVLRLDSKNLELIPDVEIYYNAVQYALEQDIFYDEDDIEIAKMLLAQGSERANQLQQGLSPWTRETGLIVRGYKSKIDGSVQPYGLVVPDTFDPTKKHRLDVWHHGRNNKLSELRFIHDRQTNAGQFTPNDTFVLHTYGRYCNAMKFAGEIDTFEALEHAKQQYSIDDDRITVRGFSMGGAATWHMAVHYAGIWAAATPGAGFAETAVYQNALEKDPKPTAWEQKLWRLYDATEYAVNLHQCPTIAYSGERDKQMQAANIMAEYLQKSSLELTHIIGPGVEHKYHPDSKIDIANQLEQIVEKGRNRIPKKIRFTTYTLRYNKMLWVHIDRLEKHWEHAHIDADIIDQNTIKIKTENITALTLDMSNGLCPLDTRKNPGVIINGQELSTPQIASDRSWIAHFEQSDNQWISIPERDQSTLRKSHGLQGPIDDAFLDSFMMVTPTGIPAANRDITNWIHAEQENAIYQWKMQFRGQPRVKTDTNVTDEDIQNHNLVLWGDPSSNILLNKIADKLPIQWNGNIITVQNKTFTSAKHVPVMIFPNPLNPQHYVVINSGFTFVQNGSQSNANQTPKLPDWAIIDITIPVEKRIPEGVADCDFFGENWELGLINYAKS